MPDNNEIQIFMDTEKIGNNRCIQLTEEDYNKMKNYGRIRILITRNNTIQPESSKTYKKFKTVNQYQKNESYFLISTK